MDLEKYRLDICEALPRAESIPFVKVVFKSGDPEIAKCHKNVNTWVQENPGSSAVRGWATLGGAGSTVLLTAHSVVMRSDGTLFDITPLEDERIRSTIRFVPHLGDEEDFFLAEKSHAPLVCDSGSADWMGV